MKRLGLSFNSHAYKARFQGLAVRDWSAAPDEDHRKQRGVPLPAGFIQEISAEITRRVLGDIRPIEGAVEAARAFRGLKAVASSSPRVELHGKIRGLGLRRARLFRRRRRARKARARPVSAFCRAPRRAADAVHRDRRQRQRRQSRRRCGHDGLGLRRRATLLAGSSRAAQQCGRRARTVTHERCSRRAPSSSRVSHEFHTVRRWARALS